MQEERQQSLLPEIAEPHKKKRHEIDEKKTLLFLPPWVPQDLWIDLLEVRKKKKVPNTEKAILLMLRRLTKLRNEGHDPTVLLEEAIERGWTTVWPLTEKGGYGRDRNQVTRNNLDAASNYLNRRR
jgi:hypothetical protein